MSYTDRAQLILCFTEDELIQLTDHDCVGVVDDVVLDEAIAKASRRIEGYISPPYDLPLDQLLIDASSLPEMAAYIVRKILYRNGATDDVLNDYKDAIAWLRDVQSGKVSLGEQDTQGVEVGRTVFKQGASRFEWDKY